MGLFYCPTRHTCARTHTHTHTSSDRIFRGHFSRSCVVTAKMTAIISRPFFAEKLSINYSCEKTPSPPFPWPSSPSMVLVKTAQPPLFLFSYSTFIAVGQLREFPPLRVAVGVLGRSLLGWVWLVGWGGGEQITSFTNQFSR